MTDLREAARVDLDQLLDELVDEQAALRDAVVWSGASMGQRTPALGWDIGDQIAHLAHGDELARLAVLDANAFATEVDRLVAGGIESSVAAAMQVYRRHETDALLRAWQEASALMVGALRGRHASEKVVWVTGQMSLASFVRARLMETFAHGQDVRDAIGVELDPTDRLVHVAHLGVQTRDFSYALHGRQAPDEPVRVELGAPSGDVWTWGPPETPERITGSAADFALVVTRRRHPADTALEVAGAAASEWLHLAQCYAGPPGPLRPVGSFPDGWRMPHHQEVAG